MRYAIIKDGNPVELFPGKPFIHNGYSYSADALLRFTEEELAERGILKIAEPTDPIPMNARLIGQSFDLVDGVPTLTPIYEFYNDEDKLKKEGDELIVAIDRLRDEKIDGGFDFVIEGVPHRIQTAPSDRENIGNLGLLATMLAATKAPGDLRWLMPDKDFKFITAANDQIPMDAHQMMALYQFGLGFKDALTFHARSLKDQVKAAVEGEDYGTFDELRETYMDNWPF